MATRIGKFTKIWLEGYALTGATRNVEPGDKYDELEAGGYGYDHHFVPGLRDCSLTIDGLFNDVAGGINAALQTIAYNSPKIATVALGNNAVPAVGDPTFSIDAQEMSYTATSPRDNIVGVNATFKTREATAGLEWGKLLLDATVDGDGNGTSVDNGDDSHAGGAGYLHITGLSSGDSITVKIQDSANDADWADLITFTLDGSAVDAQRVAVAGDVDQYVRALYDVTGTGISFPIVVAFARY